MIAVIDAGNTRIKWGLHDGQSWCGRGVLPTVDAASLGEVAAGWPETLRVVVCNVAGPTVGSVCLRYLRSDMPASSIFRLRQKPVVYAIPISGRSSLVPTAGRR